MSSLEKLLFKYRGLLLDNKYLNICLQSRRVPKGLRVWKIPNGFVEPILYHNLVNLFNSTGLNMIELIINDNNRKMQEMLTQINNINTSLTNDLLYDYYLNEYELMLQNIDKEMEKIWARKLKKIDRDIHEYCTGDVYELPDRAIKGVPADYVHDFSNFSYSGINFTGKVKSPVLIDQACSPLRADVSSNSTGRDFQLGGRMVTRSKAGRGKNKR